MTSATSRLQALPIGRQTVVGLLFATFIVGTWLFLHVYAVFFLNLASAPWWLTGALTAVLCWLSVGLFIVAHDAMHGSLAPFRPRLNWSIGQLCAGLYAGFSFSRLNREHHLHHRYAGTAEDPDFDPHPPHGFFAWYVAFMRHYFGIPELARVVVLGALYIGLLGAPYGNVLLFWGLPAVLSSLQLFTFGTYLPHRPGALVFMDRHRTRSNDMPAWLSLLTCFHFGYHHEHHDQPQVPWWRLPRARKQARLADQL